MSGGSFIERLAIRAAFAAVVLTAGGYLASQYFGDDSSETGKSLIATEAQAARTTGAMAIGSVTKLPLPRFVSLKSNEVNVRRGAGTEHDVVWSYHRVGLPVEIIAEWDNWRRIRDAEGADGWVFHRLLVSRRTALIAPWANDETLPLRRSANADAAVSARLQPKVMADVAECTGTWCRITGEGFAGWIEQERLFGVYPGEQFN